MTQMYAKDSVDRFGDDLCQLLLSYLSFDERFRYEVVSKQFGRCVYPSVRVLTIDGHLMRRVTKRDTDGKRVIDGHLWSLIMNKCSNVNHIHCPQVNGYTNRLCYVFDPLDSCRHLSTIQTNLLICNLNSMQYFCQTYGQNITRFGCFIAHHKQLLTFCHKLSHLTTYSLSLVFNEDSHQLLANNLTHFMFHFGLKFDTQMFDTFIAQNKTLKSLIVRDIVPISEYNIIQFLNQLSQLKQLVELELIFSDHYCSPIEYSLYDPLIKIGLNCLKLKRFSLFVRSDTSQHNIDIFKAIQTFSQLKRLDLRLVMGFGDNDWHLFKPSLKSWPKLTHLTLHLMQTDNQFYDNIDIKCPKLQFLSICDQNSDLDINCLRSMARLRQLKHLIIHNINSVVLNESLVNVLVATSRKLQTILLTSKDGQSYHYNDQQILELKSLPAIN